MASNIFLVIEQPLYHTGYGTSLALVWVCGAACTVMFFGALYENKKRDRGDRDWRLEQSDIGNMGDDHPAWRFTS